MKTFAVVGLVVLVCGGCASVQANQELALPLAAVSMEPGTSLLDLPWINPAMKFATERDREQLATARVETPAAYNEEQKGRVSTEGAPNLPPLPATETWYPDRQSLVSLDLQTPVREPLPPLAVLVDISKSPLPEDPDLIAPL